MPHIPGHRQTWDSSDAVYFVAPESLTKKPFLRARVRRCIRDSDQGWIISVLYFRETGVRKRLNCTDQMGQVGNCLLDSVARAGYDTSRVYRQASVDKPVASTHKNVEQTCSEF